MINSLRFDAHIMKKLIFYHEHFQAMACDDPSAAGVVFSRDPANGNPSKIVVAANYGLGESVVASTRSSH